MAFQPLLPPGAPTGAAELVAAAGLREPPPGAARPRVFVNMVSTLDGRAALDGRTSTLGGEQDLEMLLELRTAADAVLIGSGTLRAEGYDQLVRAPARRARRAAAGQAEDPVAVLLSRGLDLPWDAGLFAAEGQPIVVYTGAAHAPPAVAAPVEVVRLEDPSPAAALADLHARGVRGLLCEGGPTLTRALLAGGLVDDLFLTLTPLLTGDEAEPAIVAGGRLPELARAELRAAALGGGDLFLRYAVTHG
jgi:riboflavin-specific deaminase-like protein